MAIKFEIEKHAYAFPSKVLAGNGGEHVLNMVLSDDTDNGTIVGVGAYVADSFDNYAVATAPTAFEAKIVDVASNGNYYVQVVTPADAVLICEVVDIAETYDSRFTNQKNFYNEAGKTVRGYVLHKYDIFELSAEGFAGDVEKGKTVKVDTLTGKLKATN